jgi:hypothetical protein
VAIETELYDVLGVSPTATGGMLCGIATRSILILAFHSDEIKKAYRMKVLMFALSFP